MTQIKRTMTFTLACLTAVVLGACSDPQIEMGEEVFQGTCIACHMAGLNGAPILGNSNMWGPRVTQGIPTLAEHAINGYGLMPAKGGNVALTDEQITAAVTYMVSELE